MKTIFFRKCLLLILMASPLLGHAQFSPKTLRISAINEATTLPSWRLVQLPLHPGIQIGTDLLAKEGRHWTTSLGVDLGYYYHRLYEHAVMLDGTFAAGYRFNFGLQPKLLASAGYKHSILSDAVFEYNGEEYQKSFYLGRPQFNFKIGAGLEYALNDRYSIMVDYRAMVALPYSPKQGVPFSLHNLFGAGLKFNL